MSTGSSSPAGPSPVPSPASKPAKPPRKTTKTGTSGWVRVVLGVAAMFVLLAVFGIFRWLFWPAESTEETVAPATTAAPITVGDVKSAVESVVEPKFKRISERVEKLEKSAASTPATPAVPTPPAPSPAPERVKFPYDLEAFDKALKEKIGKSLAEVKEVFEKGSGAGAPALPTPTPAVAVDPTLGAVASLPDKDASDESFLKLGDTLGISDDVLLSRVADLAKLFANGDLDTKKRAWACLRNMEGARKALHYIVNHPSKWEAKIVAAARRILVEGFHREIEAEDAQAKTARDAAEALSESRASKRKIADIDAKVNAFLKKTEELKQIRAELQDLERFGKKKDAGHAVALRAQRNEYLEDIAELRKELLAKGVTVAFTTVAVPVPVPQVRVSCCGY